MTDDPPKDDDTATRTRHVRIRHHPLKWWQDWRWIGSVAALFIAAGFVAFVINVVRQGTIIENLSTLSESNHEALVSIQRTQSGVDELVAFVRDTQARQGTSGNQAQAFFEVLCASSDPVRIEACARLVNDKQNQTQP